MNNQTVWVSRVFKIAVCFFIFANFFRFSQWALYQSVEADLPYHTIISLEQKKGWVGFEVRGSPLPEQEKQIQRSLTFFPDEILLSFSQGKKSLFSFEPRLIFYVLNEEDFVEMSRWYHPKQKIHHLDAFYTDGKIFIRNKLSSKQFIETFTHEMIHAHSDYLVQGPWYFFNIHENGDLMDSMGRGLLMHKKTQALKSIDLIPASKQRDHLVYFYQNTLGQNLGQPLQPQRKGLLSTREEHQMVKTMACCFVSLYSITGDYEGGRREPTEYWAEVYMTYFLYPTLLKQKDPVLFQAVKDFDGQLRRGHPLHQAVRSFQMAL
jgi:hypothetical protein